MDKKTVYKLIDKEIKESQKHSKNADTIALIYIESEARKVLKRCPKLKEFIMCMGLAEFTVHDSNDMIALDVTPEVWLNKGNIWYKAPKVALDFLKEVLELDSRLGIAGVPMRFTATGEKVTDW